MTSSPPPPASPAPAREQRLLEAVLALETEGQRRAFLASLDDPDLRRRLEDLIAASADADSFFGKAPEVHAGLEKPDHTVVLPASKPPAEAPAQVIGRYKLLEKVGEGGFGEVWMAEQREPVKRRGAVK